ncbi:ATP-binding protein [Amycolatopsis sp. NPDC054798]
MPEKADVVAALRAFRLRAGLTQEELAERSGISVSTIRGLETGKRRNPQLTSVRRLAQVLGLDPAEREQLLDPAPVPGPRVLPRQLPAAPEQFTGRDAELAEMDFVLSRGSRMSVVVLCGAGGIGKTALALRWAGARRDQFPDGQLYRDLHGFDPSAAPSEPGAVLSGFLEALGVDLRAIPHHLDSQTVLFRSLLADRRMLLVLDNVRDAAQVLPLLPDGAGSLVLITSRHRLTGLAVAREARLITVQPLDEATAGVMVRDRIGPERADAEPAAVREIVRQCAGLPLALSIVTARAHVVPHFPIAVLAKELRDRETLLDGLVTGDQLTDLRAVFGSSVSALPADSADLFALLSPAPLDDASIPAAAALAGWPPPRTVAAMNALEAAHLVVSSTPGRYRMHDLVRLYGTEYAGTLRVAGGRAAADRRLVDHFLHSAYAGERLFTPHLPALALDACVPDARPQTFPDAAAAAEWFETERHNLLALQQFAAEQESWLPVFGIARLLFPFHELRGRFADEARTWRLALTAAERLGDPAHEAQALRRLGRASAHLGKPEEALRDLERARAISEARGDTHGLAMAHYVLGWTRHQLGDASLVRPHAEQAAALFTELGNPAWRARSLTLIGWARAQAGEFAPAREACEHALARFRAQGDVAGQAENLGVLSYIAFHTGNFEESAGYCRETVELCQLLGNAYLEAEMWDHLGRSYRALGDVRGARRSWRHSLAMLEAQHRKEPAAAVRAFLSALA